MTIRLPLSTTENLWSDAQRVTQEDMQTEQSHNSQADAAIINNHFGSGILLSSPIQKILFDSDNLNATQASIKAAGSLDGTGLNFDVQPSDLNLGNQLEVELTGSSVFGRFSTRVLIIGLDFQGNTQYDRLTFHKNEIQVTSKHYTHILTIFLNDFVGNHNCSRNFGGRITIKESSSFQLSRNPIMVAQDVMPNLFFRDFKTSSNLITLSQTLQNGIGPAYSFDSLVITTTVKINRYLNPNDVTSQVGQKFLATTNNIQKISLLLGVVANTSAAIQNEFDWAGDLVISIYPLQKTVDCPTDIIPELAIDFDPEITPLAQLSFNQATLRDAGVVLNDVLQPVDFVLSATQVGNTINSVIEIGEYYCVTIRRSGAATTGTLFTGTGTDLIPNARATLFSGVWVDVPEEDLWFQVWTDAAKVADGQAYDAGNGIDLSKTAIDPETGATIDNQLTHLPFTDSGTNVLNIGVVQAIEVDSVPTEDERTGSPIFSRQRFEPSFSFVNEINLENLQDISEPLIIGAAKDINPRQNPDLTKWQYLPGLARGDLFCVVNPDADLLSLNLVGSKLIPNTNAGFEYRIFSTELCVDGYGDVNGDGVIDANDIARAAALVGESIHFNSTQGKIRDGYISTLELLRADVNGDGLVSSADVDLITAYVNRTVNAFPVGSSFPVLCMKVQQSIGRADGYYDSSGANVRLDGNIAHNVVPASSLSASQLIYVGYPAPVDMAAADSAFTTIPFVGVNFEIVPQPFWQDYFLTFSSNARIVASAFTSSEGIEIVSTTQPLATYCVDKEGPLPDFDPGRNDFYIPDNLIIGKGQILKPDGSFYKIDYEIGKIILELPVTTIAEGTINIFDKLVADNGTGLTNAGFPALRFADLTTVKNTALANNQVRFTVAIQSININLPGINLLLGVFIDPLTGILTLNTQHLVTGEMFETLITKLDISVHLKKAGWVNSPLKVSSNLIAGLISV